MAPPGRAARAWLRGGVSDFFSAGWSATLVPGPHVEPGRVRGYHIDLRVKPKVTEWPPDWLRDGRDFIKIAQWALGSYERFLSGEGEAGLMWALEACRYLVRSQRRDGPRDGGWEHTFAYPHTFDLRPPWLSAMAQGEAASLLVRLHQETGDGELAEAAVRALRPMALPTDQLGVRAFFRGPDGPWFPEEYPTTPSSFVLNGGIYALWGYYDVSVGLGDRAAADAFAEGVDALAANLHRWDTGSWSRYDLYPHPVPNLASSAYHLLHVNQLAAMQRIAPRPQFEETRARFERYARSAATRTRAMAGKAAFRLTVPRNRFLAGRLPWRRKPAGG